MWIYFTASRSMLNKFAGYQPSFNFSITNFNPPPPNTRGSWYFLEVFLFIQKRERASSFIHAVRAVVRMQALVCSPPRLDPSVNTVNITLHFDERRHTVSDVWFISVSVLNSFGTLFDFGSPLKWSDVELSDNSTEFVCLWLDCTLYRVQIKTRSYFCVFQDCRHLKSHASVCRLCVRCIASL